MNLFAGLDPRDRKLLALSMALVLAITVGTALFARNQNRDDNPVPSSYLTGRHGARAAYETLEASGYHIERWEDPLTELAQRANPRTVLILADPFVGTNEDWNAVETILDKGARVVATGIYGGAMLPGGAAIPSMQFRAPCKLTADGLDALAGSGTVWMVPAAAWAPRNPSQRVEYDCAGAPLVVEYGYGAGHVVWWAAATPLENGSIRMGDNLNLLLNALGPRDGHEFYWDESLHGDKPSQWFYARGSALNLLIGGCCGMALLLVFSLSRRSGPMRPVPQPARATPVEFVEALGALYGKAGAANAAVSLAYDRFRRRMGSLCGREGLRMSAEELADALRARFAQTPPELEADLEACAEAIGNDRLEPKRALAMVQALNRHGDLLTRLARMGVRE